MALFWTQKQDIGPSARTAHGLAYDAARDRVVVFGGDPGGAPLSDTWAWDGSLWTQVADTGPTARHGSGMAYEPQSQRVALFGGASGAALFEDTWEWDGSEWTQAADTGPDARTGHAVAYDAARGQVVLFGGSAGAALRDDTWTWDGNEWTQVQDVGPSARQGHALAYHAATQRVVLFGGADTTGAGLDDTWAWDGTAWSQIADTGPDPRVGAAMAANGGLVLFGGINSVDPALAPANRVVYSDTWQWGADGWSKVQDIGPSPRWGHGMAYRGPAGRAVLFGGASAFAAPQDATLAPSLDTWELPVAASQPNQPPPTGVAEVITVMVQPDTIPANAPGMMLDVIVQLATPVQAATQLDVVIAVEQAGSWTAAQPPGFDFQPQMIPPGIASTQFQVFRNADPLQPGNYAVAVAPSGGQYQLGMFTLT
jgi:hypothetical protein